MAIADLQLSTGGDTLAERMIGTHFGQQVSERRVRRMVSVVERRLTSVTLVLENIIDGHNASAMIRSAEGLGIENIHIVEQPHPYKVNRSILRGAHRWVSIHRYQRIESCTSHLKERGFLLAVADVGNGCVPVHQLPVDKKVAIVMGSELDGLSQRAKADADIRFTIPMAGFVESFNVSVSAAVTMHQVTHQRRAHLLAHDVIGELSLVEQEERLLKWMERSAMKRAPK